MVFYLFTGKINSFSRFLGCKLVKALKSWFFTGGKEVFAVFGGVTGPFFEKYCVIEDFAGIFYKFVGGKTFFTGFGARGATFLKNGLLKVGGLFLIFLLAGALKNGLLKGGGLIVFLDFLPVNRVVLLVFGAFIGGNRLFEGV